MLKGKELGGNSVVKDFFTTASDGKVEVVKGGLGLCVVSLRTTSDTSQGKLVLAPVASLFHIRHEEEEPAVRGPPRNLNTCVDNPLSTCGRQSGAASRSKRPDLGRATPAQWLQTTAHI